jgi:hypothetical protein
LLTLQELWRLLIERALNVPRRLRLIIGLSILAGILIIAAVRTIIGGQHRPVSSPAPTYARLRLDVQPETAAIQIDGKPAPTAILPILTGDHRIHISSAGYESLDDTLHLTAGSSAVYHRRLKPSPLILGIEDVVGSSRIDLNGSSISDSARVAADEKEHHLVAHVPRVSDIPINFTYRTAAPPQVSPLEPEHGASVVAIASFRTKATIYANRTGWTVAVNNSAQGVASASGLPLDNLPRGATITVSDGKLARDYRIDADDPPVLRILIGGGRDVDGGAILISANQDATDILIDGQPSKRPMRNGRLTITSLKPGDHTVQIGKPGFCVSPDSFTGKLIGTERISAKFQLEPYPSLRFEGGVPGVKVSIDGAEISGLSVGGLSPGNHTVRATAPGYEEFAKALSLTCGVDQTVSLAGIGRARPTGPVPMRVTFTVDPSSAAVSLLRADGSPVSSQPVKSPLELVPGSYRLHGSLSGYDDADQPFVVRNGEQTTIPLVLHRASPKDDLSEIRPAPVWTSALRPGQKSGWQKASALALFGQDNATGSYTFRIKKRGFGRKSFSSWVVGYRSAAEYVEFRIEGKELQWREPNGSWTKAGVTDASEKTDEIYVRVTVDGDSVSTEAGTSVESVSTVGSGVSVPPGRFGITKDTEISGFAHSARRLR